MAERPYVILSCAVSLDGFLDDCSASRLVLSNPDDLDRVDELRASCDAILVGARTVRSDNPRLLVRDPARRAGRVARGSAPTPLRATLTRSGRIDPGANLFTVGEGEAVVFAAAGVVDDVRSRLADHAAVVALGDRSPMRQIADDLAGRGVRRLLVEGGGEILTGFLTEGVADELRLAVAPFFLGEAGAPRAFRQGRFPWPPSAPAVLRRVENVSGTAVLEYDLSIHATGGIPT